MSSKKYLLVIIIIIIIIIILCDITNYHFNKVRLLILKEMSADIIWNEEGHNKTIERTKKIATR